MASFEKGITLKMIKKYYIDLESKVSGKYYRDKHCSDFPTFFNIKDAYLYSTKDYSNYFWKNKTSAKYHIISEDKSKDDDPVIKEEVTLSYHGDLRKD